MDIHILNVRDTLERIMYLQTQLRVQMEFSPKPLQFCEGTPRKIHLYGHESFVEACQAYQIEDKDVKRDYHYDGDMCEYFNVRDFEIFALLSPDEEGYIPKETEDANE